MHQVVRPRAVVDRPYYCKASHNFNSFFLGQDYAMKTEVATWVATAVGSPLIVVILCWTLVIYHYHRRQWQPADLLVAAVIVQGIVKQVATFFYALLTLLQPFGCKQPLCSAVSWLLNSVHFLQAATLVTFTASRLLAVRYPHRYKQVVKRTHLTYHLVSLAMLATCIGIASVLAETKSSEGFVHYENTTVVNSEKTKTRIYCVFLPHELDQRYAVMSIAMHSLLNLASIIMLVTTGFGWCLLKKQKKAPHTGTRRHGQLLKSDASVMSDTSVRSAKQDGGLLVKENQFNPDKANTEASMVQNIRKLRGESLSVITRNGFENGKNIATLIRNAPQNILTSQNQNNTPNGQQLLNSSNTCNYNYPYNNQNSPVTAPTPPTIYKIPSISNYSNNTTFNSFINDSNFEEIYDNIYTKHANEKAENISRWATESSCISSSTTSTNSRAPCLAHQAKKKSTTIQWEEIRLSTAVAVLGLCYIFNHVPALILSMIGTFVSQLLPPNWPLHLVFFWTGMAEECLLPVILALFDENFSGWVHSTYTSDRRLLVDLARHHQGLDGRFRIFNPPLLDIQPHHQLHNQQQQVKFPITNGSLFTAVGGRHPVIHHYRRGTRLPITVPSNCTSSSVSSRDHYALQNSSGLKQIPALIGSQSSYTDESRKLLGDYRGFQMFQEFSTTRKNQDEKNTRNMNLSDLEMKHSSLGREEDLNSELTNFGDVDEPIYATLSSRSCCSATTAANDDFEFYQHEANAVACCKSSEIYFSDESVSNILETEKHYSPENSACSHMVAETGETYEDEFASKEKVTPQFQFEGQLHVCAKTSKCVDIGTLAAKEPDFKNEMSTTAESLLSAIENEIKNREQAKKMTPSLIVEIAEQSYTNCQLNVSPMTTVGCDSSVLETQTVSKCGYCDVQKSKKDQKEMLRDRGKKSITLSPYSHRRYISKGFLKSLSVDNFDELNEELNYHKDTDTADWGGKCCSDYQKQHSVYEIRATDRKEVRHVNQCLFML